MESQQAHLPLPDPDPQMRWLSRDCALHRDGDWYTVLVAGSPFFRFEAGNKLDARLAAAVLANAEAASIKVILEAFDLDDATLWRVRRRLLRSGVAGLVKGKTGPRKPFKLIPPIVRRIIALRREKNLPSRAIAQRLRISHTAVLGALREVGELPQEESVEAEGTQRLPFESELVIPKASAGSETTAPSSELSGEESGAPSSPAELTIAATGETSSATNDESTETSSRSSPSPSTAPTIVSQEPSTPPTVLPAQVTFHTPLPPLPSSKRAATPEEAAMYTRLGFSYDGEAEVVFEAQESVRFGGVLLAVPFLAATGLLDAARRVYGGFRHGLYGLRAMTLVLAVLTLLRRPRSEHLKGMDPTSLGDVLGLLRAPEVKTVRRKLAEVASVKKAHLLMEEVAKRWLAEANNGDELGTLYLDGHVRDYHGKHKLPKTHISQRNLCAPATTDYWVNGVDGNPLFVVTAKANAAMTKMLPGVIDKAEELSNGRKGTVVFDRGGWSPALFKEIRKKEWHILTYRKGKIRKHPRKGFKEQSLVIDGKERRYTLSERNVRLRNGLKLHEIAELREDGGQTIILTSHFDKSIVLLAYRMFERWRQENFFRYMKENFELDALVDYEVEPDDPDREVPNPAWKALDKKLVAARAEVTKLERAYGAAAAENVEAQRPTMRGFKIANSDIGQDLRVARAKVDDLICKRAQLPKRVKVKEAIDTDEIVKLSTERKVFTDVIKAACYRAETALLRRLEPHFPRAEDEGRAFLKTVLQHPADILVDGDDVTIRLAPLSAPRFTSALVKLCDELNATKPIFPETTYRLRYEVAGRMK